jgi:hypothetical protein
MGDGGDTSGAPAPAGAILRSLLRLAVILVLVYAIRLLIGWASDTALSAHPGAQIGMIATLLLVYTLLMATPFVPGIEIGISLMMIEGYRIAPLVYLATVLGLTLAFCAGEWLPYRWLRRVLDDLRLRRAAALLERARGLDRDARLALLQARAPGWLRPFVLRLRYLLVAALVNLPGNAVIGGGGGILLIAGLSRLFHPVVTLLTIALAVLPVPLAVWIFGVELLG